LLAEADQPRPASRIYSFDHSATRPWPAQWSNVPAIAGSMVQRAGQDSPAGPAGGDCVRAGKRWTVHE